jgi:flavodoxin
MALHVIVCRRTDLAGRLGATSGEAYGHWREENYFCLHTKKLQALLSERSEFKCLEFYKKQK